MMEINLKLVAVVAVVALGTVATADATLAASTIVAQAAAQKSPASNSAVIRPSTTLAQAVRLAEQHTDGRARKVELDRDDGIYIYKVKTVSKNGNAKVYIDFRTGDVLRVDSRGFLGRVGDMFDSKDRRKNEARLNALVASPDTPTATARAPTFRWASATLKRSRRRTMARRTW
ncbi:MAG: PepSY domain-containing protein [Alphaproteobacteria bacterium]|nr:PepSY domain-containing protein [Alphaproteobacteria bacterium]